MKCIYPTKHKLKRGHIIQDSVVDGAALRVSRRKLNTISNMHGRCTVFNGADNLKFMCDDLQFTDTIAYIFHGDVELSGAKREEE